MLVMDAVAGDRFGVDACDGCGVSDWFGVDNCDGCGVGLKVKMDFLTVMLK